MVYIQLKDKEKNQKSKKVSLEDIIYNQNEIEFEFGEYGQENYNTLPYNDFLFFQNNYEVICKIKE